MGMLFDKITLEERAAIDDYRRANSGNYHGDYAPLEYILEPWEAAKNIYLSRLFKDNLILSKTVSFETSMDSLEYIYSEEISNRKTINKKSEYLEGARTFIRTFTSEFIDEHYNQEDGTWSVKNGYGREVQRQGHRYDLMTLIDSYNILKGEYPGETFAFPIPNGKEIKVQHGCKPVKVLGKIAEAFGLDCYEDFRIYVSQLLNQKCLKGNLCISIHPLDYMTMSDNACGWRSCMTWTGDGEYRQGTVEMMNSPMVVVAYLTASEPFKLNPHFSWSNKKWRELYVVTPDIITNIKSYPYKNENLTKEVLKWLKELAGADNYTEDTYKYSVYNEFVGPYDKDIEIQMGCGYMYNDFEFNDGQFCYLVSDESKYKNNSKVLEFYYSGVSECMVCGERDIELDCEEENSLVCHDCGEPRCEYYCDNCGDGIRYEEDAYYLDGGYYCEYCYNEYGREDPVTYEVHHVDNMAPLRIVNDDVSETWGEPIYVYLHGWFWEDASKYFKKIYKREFTSFVYVKLSDLTEAGLDLFNFDEDIDDWYQVAPYHRSAEEICLYDAAAGHHC